MDEKIIPHLVARFLSWKLPSDFHPDAGISFTPNYNNGTPEGGRHEPTGTNLLNAEQAFALVRHLLDHPAAIEAMGQDPELEALRELSAAYAGGDIVGFRMRFRTDDDQDQTLMSASGDELATTYSLDTARFIAACVNYVRLKLQDASPADPELGWQPISTAPKDGTRVLLLLRGPKPPEIIAHWTQDWTAEEDDAFEWVNDEDDAIYGTPTHWRPLPAPPADPRVKEGG